ncbi:MAG: 4-(cytidine 5'-diphospho)-2-C-methyl-D-erythritol kinase [Desulfonauticus sp.]|nr:4-(cytidine 5'-diphospho)-2-C-methyl-D-erythritol kinase [Desulfonauticus sp.]
MSEVYLTSGCKVNLFLRIHERLASGYHLLTSVFIPLDYPQDRIKITLLEKSEIHLKTNLSSLATNNILEKVFYLFKQETGFKYGCSIFLDKRVPLGAGLGGGSANAAVFLKYLNSIANFPLSQDRLLNLASRIGADVPFFLLNQSAWVEGIGDKICPLELNLKGWYGLLVYPKLHISTAWAYQKWDELKKKQKTYLTFSTWTNKRLFSHGTFVLLNDFERVVFKAYPCLRELKEKILALGASGGCLSGSGSAMFFLFRNRENQKKALNFVEKESLIFYNYLF